MFLRATAITLLGLAIIFGLAWLVQGNDFFMYRYFAPKQEQVRRETFEQSKAYNDGMLQDLRRAQLDYAKTATPEQKLAIGSLILHRVAGYDHDKLPLDLRQFVRQLEAEQAGGVK